MSSRSQLLGRRPFQNSVAHATESTSPANHIVSDAYQPLDQQEIGHPLIPSSTSLVSSQSDTRVLNGIYDLSGLEELERRAESVLLAASVVFDKDLLSDVVSTIRKTNHFYAAAFDSLLEVGRALNSLQRRVGPGGYKALVKANLIRVNEATASKLRQIAAAIDNHKIPKDLINAVPRTLNGAYIIASLPAEEIEALMRQMVKLELLPDAPTRKLEAAVKQLRTDRRPHIADLQLTLERKLKAREQLDHEIIELRAAMRKAEADNQNEVP